MLERLLNALFAAALLALFAVPSIALWQGARFEWLRNAGGHGSELLILLLVAATPMLALPKSTLAQWRVALWLAAAECVGAAVLGWSAGAPLHGAMAAALGAIAAACGWTAQRLRPARKQPVRPTAAVGAASRPDGARLRRFIFAAWPWLLVSAGTAMSFALAMQEQGAGRNAGALALLATVLLGVPAAALRHWFPRVAAMFWLLAAALIALSAARGGGPGLAAVATFTLVAGLATVCRPRENPGANSVSELVQ